jgi:hypothetical protein
LIFTHLSPSFDINLSKPFENRAFSAAFPGVEKPGGSGKNFDFFPLF